MRRPATLLIAAVVAAALFLAAAAPSGAITFGQPDGNRHPYAGRFWPTGTRIALGLTSFVAARSLPLTSS